jgi:hypothetical protein
MAIVDFDTECWGDPWVQELSPPAKLLFVYLWTNVHRNIAGLYVITRETIAFDTKIPKNQLDQLFLKLSPKVRYDPIHSICWVVKHARRQFLRWGKISPKQRDGMRKHALKLKWHPFFQSFLTIYPEFFSEEERDTLSKGMDTLSKGMDTLGEGSSGSGSGSGISFKEEMGVQREEEKEREPDQSVDSHVKEFIDFYFQELKGRFGIESIIEDGKDGALIKRLLQKIDFNQLKTLLVDFLDSDDPFIQKSGYTIGVFKSVIQKLRIKPPPGGKSFRAANLWLRKEEARDAEQAGQKKISHGLNENESNHSGDKSQR